MQKPAYSAPEISLHSATASSGHELSSSIPVVLLSLAGRSPAKAWETALPTHLKQHSAWKGELGARVVVHGHQPPIAVVGLGKLDELNEQETTDLGEGLGRFLLGQKLDSFRIVLPAELQKAETASLSIALLKGLMISSFRVDEFRSKKPAENRIKKIEVSVVAGSSIQDTSLTRIRAIGEGMAFCRQLAELPGHSGDPAEICRRFKAAVDPKLVEVEIWDEKRIAKEKMGLLLSVARGSDIPPRFLVARYGKEHVRKQPWLALVGKGVTFDTGGINLKTGDWKGLIEMKKDMSGAAAVLGTMVALQRLKPKVPVLAITPLTFNMIDARSTLPGDVVTSYAGHTVEIKNTDAEGRLILADALHYAVGQKPAAIVDVATLTGACIVALGNHYSGCFSNHDRIQGRALELARRSGEPAWALPSSKRYEAELKSEIADFANMGMSRDGGASIAAAFLRKFVGETPWVHFDIAGTDGLTGSGREGAQSFSAGRMVHTLTQIALAHADGEFVRG